VGASVIAWIVVFSNRPPTPAYGAPATYDAVFYWSTQVAAWLSILSGFLLLVMGALWFIRQAVREVLSEIRRPAGPSERAAPPEAPRHG
jgi:ABC-type nickel/cobalt efflux system permease component RcnA